MPVFPMPTRLSSHSGTTLDFFISLLAGIVGLVSFFIRARVSFPLARSCWLFLLLLTRQPNRSASSVMRAPAASFDNAACRCAHGGPSLKNQFVGGIRDGASRRCGSWQWGRPFPTSRALICTIPVALRTIYLVVGLITCQENANDLFSKRRNDGFQG